MESDWRNLPRDILEAVSKKITSIEDYLRLRAVCIPWRSALSPAPRHLPPQLPWLMLPYNPHSKEGNTASLRSFYDISTGKIRQINLPETCGKQYCGSSRGWLVLEDGPEFSLLNPVTRVQMQLPSLKVLPTILHVSGLESKKIRSRLDVWPSRYNYKEATDPIIQKVILTTSPLDSDCIIMALFKCNWGLAFSRIRDESWTIFEISDEPYQWIDCTYHNGLFYCFSYDEVRVYDCKGANYAISKIRIPLEQGDYHLIEGEVEEILLVAQHRARHGLCKRDKFSIYKLGIDEKKKQPNWIKVRGIGEKMCFICEGIEQCFIFPVANVQMSVLGNLFSYTHLLVVEKKDIWQRNLKDKHVYDIKVVKLPVEEVPGCSKYRKKLLIKLKSFGSYLEVYSLALWITPSFY